MERTLAEKLVYKLKKELCRRRLKFRTKTSKSTNSVYFYIEGVSVVIRISDHATENETVVNIGSISQFKELLWHIGNNNLRNVSEIMGNN